MNTQDVEQLLKGQVGFILATAMFLIVGLIVMWYALPVIKSAIAALDDNTAATKEIAQANRDFMEAMKNRDATALRDMLAEIKAINNHKT